MAAGGAKVWYIPDGYLPEKTGDDKLQAHEALMLLNVGPTPANVKLDFYFENKPPAKDISATVPAERVICLRLDKPEHIGDLEIPTLTQYAIRVRSDAPIVVQFGRLDTTQPNLAYYGSMGYGE
jgi:hypothetical protein